MILEVLGVSVLAGVAITITLSTIEGEKLHSLSKNEQGKLNPNLPVWIILSLIHVVLVFAWGYLLEYLGVIRLQDKPDDIGTTVAFFFYYWFAFESMYYCLHRIQHKFRWFALLTGHKGELSDKWHHGMKPPYGPDYITAFSSHPMDAFVVQFSAQSPWFWYNLVFPDRPVSTLSYGLIITWLVYCGMRAHSRQSFGGKYHCKHHDNPAVGPYSFSGMPERFLCIKY